MSSHLKVTVNGDVVMEGDMQGWQQREPEFVTGALKSMADGKPAPYMRALMLVIAEAAMTQTYTEAEVKSNGSGWSLSVRYAIELEA